MTAAKGGAERKAYDRRDGDVRGPPRDAGLDLDPARIEPAGTDQVDERPRAHAGGPEGVGFEVPLTDAERNSASSDLGSRFRSLLDSEKFPFGKGQHP